MQTKHTKLINCVDVIALPLEGLYSSQIKFLLASIQLRQKLGVEDCPLSNNQQIHSELDERICPTLEEAIAYLKTVKGYFEKGILDEIVDNHLNKLRERSANARKKKQEYKDAVQIRPGEPVDVLTEIRLHKTDIAA